MKNKKYMNLLILTDYNIEKSVIYDIHILSENLSINGHNVYLACSQARTKNIFSFEKKNINRVYDKSKAVLYTFNYLSIPYIGEFIGFYTGYKLIRSLIIKHNIDVIILYSVIFTGISSILIGKTLNVPIVFRNIDMLHRIIKSKIKRILVKKFERIVYNRVQRLLALTPQYGSYLKDMGADYEKIKLLAFPIDINIFNPQNININLMKTILGDNKSENVILFIGYLYMFSALDEFLYEFQSILDKVPDAKLIIVGDGPLRKKLERIISKHNLKNSVFITGIKPFESMPHFINAASVCINVFPVDGEMQNLFSAKLVQYLACAKPIVSSALPGLVHSLPSYDTGIIYKKSINEMNDSIVKLLLSKSERKLLGNKGIEYIIKYHDKKIILKSLENTLYSVLNFKSITEAI